MQSSAQRVVILGTGGTIAGVTSSDDGGHVDYEAGALGIDTLIAAIPALKGQPLEALDLMQVDSCDMAHADWLTLHHALAAQLARPEVAGVVVTHGTDTLEETAYFLHRTLLAAKPVVLTAAMRPATAPSPDGPQNLLDAVTLAQAPGAHGVLAMFGGRVFAGRDLRKLHGYRVEAFGAGDAGDVGLMEDGTLRRFRDWPQQTLHAAAAGFGDGADAASWPVVDIVTSHAGARGAVIDALVAAGAHGIVVAGTGNGSVHDLLHAAAERAEVASVRVRRASRCLLGGVVGQSDDELPAMGVLTPAQARIELMLDLLLEQRAA